MNTKYTYDIRIELSNVSSCVQRLNLYEHGRYILNVKLSNTLSTNTSSDLDLQCQITTDHLATNIYAPLIVSVVILLALFIVCIIAQRMKIREHLVNLKNHYFNHVPQQECTHSYDLQTTTICQTTIETMNNVEYNSNVPKVPSIQKLSHIIVPRSKRLLSLDAFRGLGIYF